MNQENDRNHMTEANMMVEQIEKEEERAEC